jgi:hypothetical protein
VRDFWVVSCVIFVRNTNVCWSNKNGLNGLIMNSHVQFFNTFACLMIWFLHHLAERFVALWLIGLNLHFKTIRWYTYRYLPIDLVIDGFPAKFPQSTRSTRRLNSFDSPMDWMIKSWNQQWGDHGWSWMIKPPNHSRIKSHEI